MSDATLADLRAALEQERDNLVSQLAALGEGEFDPNFADSSQVTAERGEVEALAGSLRETWSVPPTRSDTRSLAEERWSSPVVSAA